MKKSALIISLLAVALIVAPACALSDLVSPPSLPTESPPTTYPEPPRRATPALQEPSVVAPQMDAAPQSAADSAQPSLAQRQLFVSPLGNDKNPGTRQQPWASPGYASRQLQPGDELVILPGRYVLREYDADVLTPPSGTADAWIHIRGEGGDAPGSRPVLAGRQNLLTAINLSGVHYVHIENLEITHDEQAQGEEGFFRDGVQIMEQPASHVVLKDLYIHHLDEFGMNFQDVQDLQIHNARIEYAGFGALGGPAGVQGGWRGVLISGGEFSYSGQYYQGGDGTERPYDRPDGLGVEDSAGPLEIENARFEHNRGDGLDSKVATTIVRRTIIANNSCDGLKLWGTHSRIENTLIYGRGDGVPEKTPWSALVIASAQPGARHELVNLTVDDILGGNYLIHVQYDQPEVPITLDVRNSIFRSEGPSSSLFVAKSVDFVSEHNLFYLPQSECVLTRAEEGCELTQEGINTLGKASLYTAPLFMNPTWGEEGDYHLQPDSPARKSGTPEGAPPDDLDGKPRQTPPDRGVYEMD